MKSWEYKEETILLRVNQLANKGWRVISAFSIGSGEFQIAKYILERELRGPSKLKGENKK